MEVSTSDPERERHEPVELTRLLLFQVWISALVSFAIWLWLGTEALPSALAGAAICVVPSTAYAMWVTPRGAAQSPEQILRLFFVGEVLKLGATACLFALSFLLIDITPVALFLTYIAALTAYWLSLIFPRRGT